MLTTMTTTVMVSLMLLTHSLTTTMSGMTQIQTVLETMQIQTMMVMERMILLTHFHWMHVQMLILTEMDNQTH